MSKLDKTMDDHGVYNISGSSVGRFLDLDVLPFTSHGRLSIQISIDHNISSKQEQTSSGRQTQDKSLTMSTDHSDSTEACKWPEPKNPWEKMVDCETCKGRHFGSGGAAGILLVRRDYSKVDRPVTNVILQHRSYSTTAGGTWALPGGALDEGENPRQGALREASEEVGLPQECADGPDPVVTIWYERAFLDHGAWKYTTVIADVVKPFEPTVPQGDAESLEVKWVPIKEVEALPLHPSFEQAWPALRSILETAPGASKP